MKLLFKGWKSFLMIFLSILFIDILLSSIESLIQYRYISKLLITTTLYLHFYFNNSGLLRRDKVLVSLALLFSFIADFFIITDSNLFFLAIGTFMFILAKTSYSIVFSYKAKFDIDRLLPFLAVTLLYCLFIMYFLYDGLGKLFIPVVIYTFASLVMTKMAYLRYKRVNNRSYYMVLLGTIFFVISESILSWNNFYKPLSHSTITIMLFYGLSQLLTIKGIIEQNKINN